MERERVKDIIDQFSAKKVIVLGDFYLDEYFHCHANQFSPEAPVPRAVINKVEHIPGCAGNVAISLKSLGAQVVCAGVMGNDEKGNILRNKLLEKGIVTTGLFPDVTRVTGVFSRILLEGSGDTKQHFIRFDQENKDKISTQMQQSLLKFLEDNLDETDLLVIADYDEAKGTGLITEEFLSQVTELAKKYGIPLAGQSRLKIKQFEDFNIIFCNKKEAAEVVDNQNSFNATAEKLLQETNVSTAVITEGKNGLTIFKKNHEPVKTPSFAKNIVDVCGAGDSLSSAYSLASLTDATEQEKGFIASHAAAVAISKPGTSPVYPHEVIKSASSKTSYVDKIIINQAQLLQKLDELKKDGKKIVFTNGYFDLIRSGHINFLRQAKEQGDILVVAINSDRSVKENKGEGSPLLNEEERLNVLSIMDFVDFLTVFDESTPLKIISLLKPHILAKGGNHNINEIVGKDVIEANGGEVKIIPLS